MIILSLLPLLLPWWPVSDKQKLPGEQQQSQRIRHILSEFQRRLTHDVGSESCFAVTNVKINFSTNYYAILLQ